MRENFSITWEGTEVLCGLVKARCGGTCLRGEVSRGDRGFVSLERFSLGVQQLRV